MKARVQSATYSIYLRNTIFRKLLKSNYVVNHYKSTAYSAI